MKGIVTDIKRMAVHDGPGIRTTIFLKGCPLLCRWCHNPEGLDAKPQVAYMPHKCLNCGACRDLCAANSFGEGGHTYLRENCIACGKCEEECPGEALRLYGKTRTVQQVVEAALEDRVFYVNSGGGVTLSGGECLLQAEFCAEVLKKLKVEGIHTAVDTCGFVSRGALCAVLPHTDLFLYDVKAMDRQVHIRCTGRPNDIILDNLRFLDGAGANIEVRIPFVPGFNDGEMEAIGAFLLTLDRPPAVRVLAYHPFAASRYEALGLENTLPSVVPEAGQLQAVCGRLRAMGLNVLL